MPGLHFNFIDRMSKKFNNALLNETSPYLLQHAHNPVFWYPWGDEALTLAKEKDLPILVSIGYSACHWCHVMERESFEDETVAAYMNNHFINIKIDREERPDLDHIYMDALQAIAGNGGWPLNIFLTTDAKPFYGGTYFPPQKAYNRASWSDVLHSMTDVWKNKRADVERQAESLVDHIKKSNSLGDLQNIIPATETVSFFNEDDCRLLAANILKNADHTDGGFGKAPKFLQTSSIQYLIQFSFFYNDAAAKQHALRSLQKMLNGGIYDQLAGGISRYSTDNQWLAPHFEKMLYDNALLTIVLSDAYQLSKEKEFENGIRSTLDFFINEMKHPEGGFYTALDADSEGEEGKFYVWQKKDIIEILGDKAVIFCDYYNVSEAGNWEGKNILNISRPAKDIAAKYEMDLDDFYVQIAASKAILLTARNQRTHPGVDDKILLGCNALMISALCKASAALNENKYLTEAVALYEFIEIKFLNGSTGNGLLHTYKNNEAKYPAFLDDYAYLIQACIFLQEITSNQQYLIRAKELTEYVINHFQDENSSFLYYTHKDQKDIVVRKVELYDGATPSANAIMAYNLFYLGTVFDNRKWHLQAEQMLKSVFNIFKKHPGSFALWACSYLLQTVGIHEIVITGKNINSDLTTILEMYLPNKIIQSSKEELDMPLLRNKEYDNDFTLYLCRNYSCDKPFHNVSSFLNIIKKA